MKYRSREEWTTLTVPITDGGTIDIKINNWIVQYIPTKLVFRPKRPNNQLFLPPNQAQRKRRKHLDDHRHGAALTAHILEKIGSLNVKARSLKDRFDYRVGLDGDFINSPNVKNLWHYVEDGVVLEVYMPDGCCRYSWDESYRHVIPREPMIPQYAERRSYFYISNEIADIARDFSWTVMDGHAVTRNLDYGAFKGSIYPLRKLVCELSGVKTTDVTIPARMSKYYQKAVDEGNYKSRSKYEDVVSSDLATNNRMFVAEKKIAHRRIYAEKYIEFKSPNVIAQDLRFQSIRVGGKYAEQTETNTSTVGE